MGLIEIIQLLGGLALFLYGMVLAKDGLQQAAGKQLRHLLGSLTKNRFSGIGLGALVTFLLQSSSATTVILVGLTSAGMLSFARTVSVILGADIGTTLTVQLISFKVSHYALAFVFLGFLLKETTHKYTARYYGMAIMGFGFIFYGMMVMGEATAPLKDLPWFQGMMLRMGEHPLLGILISTLFTAIIQSSAATIGIVLSLAQGGGMDLVTAVALILGANIGTCATAGLATFGSNVEGRRVAMAHVLIKVLGVLVFIPFIRPFSELVVRISGEDISRQIANAHTLFNVGLALLFLPIPNLIAKLVIRLVQERQDPGRFHPLHLDPHSLATPALAFGNAEREVLRMAELVEQLIDRSMEPFRKGDINLVQELTDSDQNIDLLNKATKLYLARIRRKNLTDAQIAKEFELLEFSSDLEVIGDVLTKNVMYLAQKKIQKGYQFSPQGNEEIETLHRRTLDHFRLALAVFTQRDPELAASCVAEKRDLRNLVIEMRRAHIVRLHDAVPESIETTSLHMDLLDAFARINSVITRMAYRLLGRPS
ncbi:MAG: Na/Pi cotransporter family protein [Deltaproteobacteria bacterium]|nr:Na/Pi cotransporter family protein [Deltaproteobacteria bacterium]